MPFYDYKCGLCGETFEEHLPIAKCTEAQLCPDPDCGGLGKRVYAKSPVAFTINLTETSRNLNLSATQRRKKWNSDNKQDLRDIS